MKDAYYFSHDSNSRFDPKILKLRSKYGLEGYGFYFCLLEIMRDSSDYMINYNELDIISYQIQIDDTKAKAMLQFCCDIGLLKTYNDKIFSESFLIRMQEMNELRAKRVEAGRKGGNAKAMLQQTHSTAVALKETKLKETKGNEIKTTTSSGYEFYINNINLLPAQYESELVRQIISEYSDDWFINACKVAIKNNARKIQYIEAVLKKSKEKGSIDLGTKSESDIDKRSRDRKLADKLEREAGIL